MTIKFAPFYFRSHTEFRLYFDNSWHTNIYVNLQHMNVRLLERYVYSHDRRVLSTPVGYSHDDQSEAR